MNAGTLRKFCYNCNTILAAPAPMARFISQHELRLVNRSQTVFAQQLDECAQTALFIGAQMVVDMPVEIILAEIVIVLGAVADDGIERVEAETFRFAQLPAQPAVLHTAAQGPDRVNKRQPGPLIPGRAQVPDFVRARR